MRSRSIKLLGGGIALVAVLTMLQCLGIRLVNVEMLWLLAAGWVQYIRRVAPQIHVRWELVGSTGLYAVILVVGSHLFLRWLHREFGSVGRAGEVIHQLGWKWRWTMSGFAIVVLMFVAGTAAVGIVHQTTWLARSPQPMYRVDARRSGINCGFNLRQIGMALQMYAEQNGGRYPDSFRPLVLSYELAPEVLLCPSSDDVVAAGETLADKAGNLLKPGHCSYIYLGKGLAGPLQPRHVLVVEPLENHGGKGMEVLYADMSIHWLDRADAEKLLLELGFERVEPDANPKSAKP